MKLFDKISQLNFTSIQQSIFRSDIEKYYFGKKDYPLPKYELFTEANLNKLKNDFSFFNFNDLNKSAFIDNLKSTNELNLLLAEGEKILENKYNLFDKGEIFLGEKIEWNKDYLSGFHFPKTLFWRINIGEFPTEANPHYCFELAKFHQLTKLGILFSITNDEKYSNKYFALFSDFKNENKFCEGINWLNPTEVAVRLINIIFSFPLFQNSKLLTPDLANAIQKEILLHTIYLENVFDSERKNFSSLTIILTALLAGGNCFIKTPYGKRIASTAKSLLESEIQKNISSDGVPMEHSIKNHLLIVEALTIAFLIQSKIASPISKSFEAILKKMFNALSYYPYSNGKLPNIGNQVVSRLLPLSFNNEKNYAYDLLTLGAIIFNDSNNNFSQSNSLLNIAFLLGENGFTTYKKLEKSSTLLQSWSLTDGGYFGLINENFNIFVNGGTSSKNKFSHNDIFTFEIFYKDKPFIVERGLNYNFYNSEINKKFSSTFSHNTFLIDRLPPSTEENETKSKDTITKPKLVEWKSDNEEDSLILQHHAYLKFVDPVISKRSFYLQKEINKLKITDEFLGGDYHYIQTSIHFHPEVRVEKISENEFRLINDSAILILKISTPSKNYFVSLLDSHYSEKYLQIEESKKLVLSLEETFPAFYFIEIYPE